MEASTLLSQDDIRSQRLARDQRALDELEAQAVDAETAVTSIQAQIVALETSLRAARDWKADVTPRRDALRTAVAAQRSALSPMSTIPKDVLSYIFQHAVRAHDNGLWPEPPLIASYDRALAKAPYTLARVCTYWRQTALTTPSLWSYVALPEDTGYPAFASHVSLLLQRSKAVELQVLVEYVPSPSSEIFNRTFSAICEHIGRWGRFYCRLAADVSYPALAGYLRASMPRVEEIYIRQDVHDQRSAPQMLWPEVIPQYLRDTHKLQRLYVRYLPIAWVDASPAINTLTRLHLGSNFVPRSALFATLRRTPQLQHLVLCASTDDEGHWVQRIHLPHLKRLVLWHRAPSLVKRCPTLFAVPRLTSLFIRLSSTETQLLDLQGFFSGCPQSLARLELTGRALNLDDIPSLRHLRHVIDVELSAFTIPATFFDSFCTTDTAQYLWPKLRRLSLNRVHIEPDDSDNIVCAVRARRISPSSDPLWERLEAMTIDDASNVPGWHRAEIKSILA